MNEYNFEFTLSDSEGSEGEGSLRGVNDEAIFSPIRHPELACLPVDRRVQDDIE
jgi:hypothetical protein